MMRFTRFLLNLRLSILEVSRFDHQVCAQNFHEQDVDFALISSSYIINNVEMVDRYMLCISTFIERAICL